MVSAGQLAATPPPVAPKGSKRTPSVEELYGALEKQGLVKIIRKKGRAPVIHWL